MDAPITTTLENLVQAAGLPAVSETFRLTGRGLHNQILAARLTDGREVLLRVRSYDAVPERARARLLETHRLPAPRLLSSAGNASLYEFAPGQPLGDLVELGTVTREDWERVGDAYRQVHQVAFPRRLSGDVEPDVILLRPGDPVAEQHAILDRVEARLRETMPSVAAWLPAVHDQVDAAAPTLCGAPTSLLHGDVDLRNILVAPSGATLLDWDTPMVGDPARELALLDMHASLANEQGLPRSFYDGYGRGPFEPNTSIFRITGTLSWLASDDWAAFEQLDADLRARARAWLATLRSWADDLPGHLERIRSLPARP